MNARPPSRCVSRSGAPYSWIWYVEGTKRVAENELDEALQQTCATQAEYEMRQSEVRQRLKRAANGLLAPESDDVVPIHMDPDLWEIRWQWDGGRQPFRLYHAEPPSSPTQLVALHAHFKRVDGSPQEIKAAQDAAIREAIRRYWRRPPA